jgi:hypothetical protein
MDFIFNITDGDVVYDIETFPNIFSVGFFHRSTGQYWVFEISDRRNDTYMLCLFLTTLSRFNCRMVGYNNIGFDYPVIHFIYKNRDVGITHAEIYAKSMSIINAPHNARFAHMVWQSDWIVPQLDLFKIHHFDNVSKSTSLKVLEFNMRMDSIEDLPFPVGTVLDDYQKDVLISYMRHDIDATDDFCNESKDQIRFREELTLKYDHDFTNHNDTKIGKDFFIMKLEESTPGCCYNYASGRRQVVQTPRDSISINDVILPYVNFDHPEFNRILKWFRDQVITETKGSIKDINCIIDGFQFDFGTGGIHGSVESQVVHSDDDWIIEDWDVASYYPNLAIVNGLHPEHLGDNFCTLYKEMYDQRRGYKKGTPENAMLKLALNGTYGDSNNKYSPFYDPKFTMSITINGQLSLCMLAEKLMLLTDLQMVQINTDGLTVRYPRQHKDWVHSVCSWWETVTGLELESAEYSRMFIRDVNNYLAEYTNGKVKRKGAYEYDRAWHQNHSTLVVPRAAEAALIRGEDIRTFITNHEDIFDFFLRTKVPRNSSLEWSGQQVSNIVRYYISTDGGRLEKVMPPAGPAGEFKRANKLTDAYFNAVMAEIGPGVWDERVHTKNKSVYEERRSGIETGWDVQLCNKISGRSYSDLNYEWYIKEAEKLVKPLLR